MLSKRYIEDKPAERRWISSLDRWLKKVHGYSVLATGPLTPPPPVRQRFRPKNENFKNQNSTSIKRYSSARPVVIVERINRAQQPEFPAEQHPSQPIINLNDHFIEVYYCTKTSHNYAGQLEKYSRASMNKMCYCCEQCIACKRDRNANLRSSVGSYNRHRPLNQTSSTRSFTQGNMTPNDNSKISKLRPYQSFST